MVLTGYLLSWCRHRIGPVHCAHALVFKQWEAGTQSRPDSVDYLKGHFIVTLIKESQIPMSSQP